jgi:hypothetical protein
MVRKVVVPKLGESSATVTALCGSNALPVFGLGYMRVSDAQVAFVKLNFV